MSLSHTGPLVAGIALLIASFAAVYYIWNTPRRYGSPRWPLLILCLGVVLRALALFLDFGRHAVASEVVGLLSAGVLWFSVGAVVTQWLDDTGRERRSF